MRVVQRSAVILAVLAATAGPVRAGVLLSQQGVLRSAAGAPVDGTYDMVFLLYPSKGAQAALWSEIHEGVLVSQGVFGVVLGADEPLSEALIAANPSLWLGVSVQGEPELPRNPIETVAFAAVATFAETAAALAGPIPSLECSGCIGTADLAKGAVTADKIAPGAIQSYHVGFPYAGAKTPGGAATNALDLSCTGCVDAAELSFVPASLADVSALGPSLDALGCKVGESPQKALNGWTCAKVQLEGLSYGKALGYELVDGLGATWDGLERPAADLDTAKATCAAVGARLPTLGELYRNRTNAPGGIGQGFQGNWLWSQIAKNTTQTMVARWSDGATGVSDHPTVRNYRCIWPDYQSSEFDGDHCMGGCFATSDGLYHIDGSDRPRMPLMVAVRECAAVNARVPDLHELESAIRSGLPNGSGSWVWTGDQYKGSNGGPPALVVNWVGANISWFPPSSFGGYNGYYGYWPDDAGSVNARCIGLRSRATAAAPSKGEFKSAALALSADQNDSLPLKYFEALDDCRSKGGHVPDGIAALGLVAAGWPNGTQLGIWTAEHHDLPMVSLHWKNAEPSFFPDKNFIATGSGFGTAWYNEQRYYRCAYPSTRPWVEPEVCKGGCFVVNKGALVTAVDKQDRDPAKYFDAVDSCRALGGRVPTARDLEELIRFGAPGGSGTGVWTASSLLGTGAGPAKLLVRWSGTDTKWFPANDFTSGPSGYQSAFPSTATPYRCVWTNEAY